MTYKIDQIKLREGANEMLRNALNKLEESLGKGYPIADACHRIHVYTSTREMLLQQGVVSIFNDDLKPYDQEFEAYLKKVNQELAQQGK